MRTIVSALMIITIMSLSGCSGSGAKDMFETAQFEELQNNGQHAASLYEDIIKKYPESEYAERAKERLSELRHDK